MTIIGARWSITRREASGCGTRSILRLLTDLAPGAGSATGSMSFPTRLATILSGFETRS
jgi:hypothetical protein